jgi:S-DNA-T family DNA segregation ATPase FtsK/SpoIIIE
MMKTHVDTRKSVHARLEKVVADYYQGIARIDREFDKACDKIERSIASIRVKSQNCERDVTRDFSREMRLREELDQIEHELSQAEDTIARVGQGIAAIDIQMRALRERKSSLEIEIQNRWVIERLCYLFFADKEKDECNRLQRSLDNQATEQAELEHVRRKFESIREQALEKKKRVQSRLEEIYRTLAVLKESSESWEEQARMLANRRTEAENRRKMRKENLWKSVFSAWEKASGEIVQAVRRIQRQQPPFVDLCGSSSCVASEMPDALLLGTWEVSFKGLHCRIPHAIPFPFDYALVLRENNEAQRRLAYHLLLRLLQAIPPGRLELVVVDPRKLGNSFAPFLPLLNVEPLMPQKRVLTRANEIEHVLGRLTDETEEMIQYRFKGRISSWTEFNIANAENPLPYKVVLIFDVPDQLSDKSLWYLERLIEHGPRCGVLPVIAVDEQCITNSRYEKLQSQLKLYTQRLDALLSLRENHRSELSFSYQPEEWPRHDVLDQFISSLCRYYDEARRFNRSLRDLLAISQKGITTVEGFEIPIGWTPAGEIVALTLGATNSEHHALLAGKTGSGKSNLLHVIIHSLCEKYDPREVDLYLLDYKESTEFTVYANPSLPHARLVGTESDPEYGVTVLEHLVSELECRAHLFKSVGVRDFVEFRKQQPSQLPRILVIIDEFHVLFQEGRGVAERAEKLLSQLLKQGRSFGIHVLLSTQTLTGINVLSRGALISQLGCRIALACGQDDSSVILSSNNWAAADLKSPPEGIINNANGAKSGNVKFIIPLAERDYCLAHLQRLSERAIKGGTEHKTRVFDGAHLPQRPTLAQYWDVCGKGTGLLLGEQLTFTSDPLWVPLNRRQAFNVLFSGYNDEIHDGLLVSSLASMLASDAFDEIVYFNRRGVEPSGGFREILFEFGERFKMCKDSDEVPLQTIVDAIGKRRVALIVDGLDMEKNLHPVSTFKSLRPGEPATPSDLLKRIAEEGPPKGTFVLAFIENWSRCAVSCKDLFSLFELRIAFCMNEDDAGAFVSGSIRKFGGIEKPNRAVFVNRMTNDIVWFRPYIGRPEGEPC